MSTSLNGRKTIQEVTVAEDMHFDTSSVKEKCLKMSNALKNRISVSNQLFHC